MGLEKTARKKFGSGYSCSQAIFCTFADQIGLSDGEARRTSSSWAGGAKVKCGAVYAAEELIRRLNPGDTDQQERLIQAFEEEYIRRNSYLNCKDLTSFSNRQRKPCGDYVASAAEILETFITGKR